MNPPTVFISYSHEDEVWKDRLVPHLGALRQQGILDYWEDRRIKPGSDWLTEIETALERAAVAVCLISADFLSSKFCTEKEIPRLLERRKLDGMLLLPVLLRPCPWKAVRWLKAIQMLPRDGKCVSHDFKEDWDMVFSEVAERIAEVLGESQNSSESMPLDKRLPQGHVLSTEHGMPITGAELFGREKDIARLDAAWEDSGTHIISVVAWGGVGKSALVNRWRGEMAKDRFRGARRIFAWSFYSQGSGERVTHGEGFMAEALKFFGDPEPDAGSAWEKGERLAALVRRERSLLILDGLEPLQRPPGPNEGRLTDPGVAALLRGLAADNPGLCVVTTRHAVADAAHYRETTAPVIELDNLSDTAGAALLRKLGVKGPEEELRQASREFGGHGLALNLLGTFLRDVAGGDVRRRSEVSLLEQDAEQGGQAVRVMDSYEKWLGEGPELEVLRLIGLFDRPADGELVEVLLKPPAIKGLTDTLAGMKPTRFRQMLARVRKARLLTEADEQSSNTLDAHPLVREHFGRRLRERFPDAWREGHNRLYEHLTETAKEFPATLAEMMPLYQAVAHGCAAGRHQEAYDEVYRRRIGRGNEYFSTSKLGAFGAELAALAGFFDSPWRKPVDCLTEVDKSNVLNAAGFNLRALGRLREAVEPLAAGLAADIQQKDWHNAAIAANNLSENYLNLGDIADALDYGRQSVTWADKSEDALQRMARRSTVAKALHQAGRIEEAAALYAEAEAMQKEQQPEYPLLYSMRGYQYCNLLLEQGKYGEVADRAEKFFEWRAPSDSLLDIALDHLSLGQANLMQFVEYNTGDSTEAETHLNQAVDGLRQAARLHEIPRGLLARAELHRVRKDFDAARRDLAEGLSIAGRGEMGLHLADAHLEYARLHRDLGKKERARKFLATAREMIGKTGYHRRDGAVAELERQLAE